VSRSVVADEYEFLHKLGSEIDLFVGNYGWVTAYRTASPVTTRDRWLAWPIPAMEAADALLDREGRLAIGGHTHRQMSRMIGLWQIINVGSISFPFDPAGRPVRRLCLLAKWR